MSIFKLYINLLKTKNRGPGVCEYGTGLFYMKVLDHNINSKFCRVVMIFERVPGVREYGTGTY